MRMRNESTGNESSRLEPSWLGGAPSRRLDYMIISLCITAAGRRNCDSVCLMDVVKFAATRRSSGSDLFSPPDETHDVQLRKQSEGTLRLPLITRLVLPARACQSSASLMSALKSLPQIQSSLFPFIPELSSRLSSCVSLLSALVSRLTSLIVRSCFQELAKSEAHELTLF